MAQMKTLNGYEVVDDTARTTKQNKVLSGTSDPASSTGSNGDVYIATSSSAIKSEIVNLIYPVGSIYISTQSTNPSTLFGGTWEAYGQGRTLIGAGTGDDGSTSMSFTAGSQGGEYNHKLTVAEMPKHIHTDLMVADNHFTAWNSNKGNWKTLETKSLFNNTGTVNENMFNTGNTGGSLSHNNTQPYITVYIWHRTR